MSNSTAEKKQRKSIIALWKKRSKDGKKTYFTGKMEDGTNENEFYLTAFYNTDKKNLKEPDMRVYARDDEGNLSKEPILSLWCNATKNGKKVLSGKIDGKRVIGFINQNAKENQPYISIYWSDEQTPKAETKEEPKQTKKAPSKKNPEPEFEEIPSDESLPF